MTSQLCIYCYNQISHPNLGTSRCLNLSYPAVKRGRACNSTDVMSAAAIGLFGMTKLILNKDLSSFCQKLCPQ
ncbi:hypothetical protein BDF21DRAFT_470295 [Thamnidium elegans]|nr:hypothetical protein BDF21DRAFT_470295 [Thamnidium elegans]